jgi:galactoside O-acetyltransferase
LDPSAKILGIPPVISRFPGIDKIGEGCRIADTVTVFKICHQNSGNKICLGNRVSLYDQTRLVLGDPNQYSDTSLILGNDIIVNTFCYLSGEGGLLIEDEVLIGPYVKILSAGHMIDYADASIWRNPLTYDRIHIGRGAWIAAGATILQGIHIGEGAVIGAACVVTHDVPAFAIVAGNPARFIRYRKGFEPRRLWFFSLKNR